MRPSSTHPVDDATCYLVCTDGLATSLRTPRSPLRGKKIAAIFELWKAAIKTGGGPDNVTVVLAEIS